MSRIPQEAVASKLNLPLAHPYTRYGLAVALYLNRDLSSTEKQHPELLNEAVIRDSLVGAIESGLNKFRMRTEDKPLLVTDGILKFDGISLEALQSKPTLVQSSGLASQGIYIYPTVVTTDGDAKGTFDNAVSIIKALRSDEASSATRKYSRSFAPTTAKINNGTASQSEPKGSLIETACAAITTLTPLKPAAWNERNTVIIPDIELPALLEFLDVFDAMTGQEAKELLKAQLPKTTPPKETAVSAKAKKPKPDAKPKSDYRRPQLHNGNYPYAPRDSANFGAVGLLAAVGRWAVRANYVERARSVLESLSSAPLYIISYDKISQIHFGHHVVNLSIESRLSEMLDALWRETKLYADLDSPLTNRQSPAYQLFYLQTSRFLQSFTPVAFRDFLAARAEYSALLEPLFRTFFDTMNILPEIVQSAGVLGQWLNRTAYFVADSEYEAGTADRDAKVRKTKAKILVEFESAAMSAKTSQDLLFRISTRAGRLLQDDAPNGAKRFMDAVASEEITQEQAVQLLITYMRLRAPRKETGEPATVSQDNSDSTSKIEETTNVNEQASTVEVSADAERED
jgi:hypothetical protein